MRRSQIPVTLSLIAVCALLFLIDFFSRHMLALSPYFDFKTPFLTPLALISMFAYPLLNPDFLTVVFASLWLFWVGGSLERSWGSARFALFFFGITAASGIGVYFGSLLMHEEGSFLRGGLWLPVTSLTVAWATINPLQTVMLYGIVPIQARWIALFEVGVIYFVYYEGESVLGLFALTGALAAYLIVKIGLMSSPSYRSSGPDLRIVNGGQNRRRPLDDAGTKTSLNPMDRYRAWQQRRKLAKLLLKSGFTDRDEDQPRR